MTCGRYAAEELVGAGQRKAAIKYADLMQSVLGQKVDNGFGKDTM